MAISKDDLIIAIEIQAGKSADAIKDLTSQFDSLKAQMASVSTNTGKTAESVDGLGFAFIKIQAAIEVARTVHEAYNKTIGESIKAYFGQIDAETKLANALAINGKYSKESFDRLKEFSEEMKKNTVISDDQALSFAATAAATGKSEEQIKKLITASAGLAAITKKDVNETFEELLQTYKGVVRGVAVYDAAIKGMTESQARNGAAVDIIAAKYSRFANEEIKTLEGRSKQITNAFEDMQKAIGEVVAGIFNLGQGSTALRDILISVGKTILENKTGIIEWGKSFISVLNAVISVVEIWGKTVATIFETAISGIKGSTLTFQLLVDKISGSDDDVAKTKKAMEDLGQSGRDNFTKLGESWGKFIDEFGKNDVTGLEKIVDNTDRATKEAEKLQAAFDKSKQSAANLTAQAKAALVELQKVVADLQAKVDKIGIGREGQLEAEAKAQMASLKVLADKAALEGLGAAAIKKQVDQATALIQLEKERTLADERLKNNKQLLADNQALLNDAMKFGKTTEDQIKQELDYQLQLNDLKRDELKFQGLLDDDAKEQLKIREQILKAQATNNLTQAPNADFEAAKKVGTDIGKNIGDALGPVTGVAGGIGEVVTALTAILDFLPQMVDAVTGLINKITDLPTVLLNATKNLNASLIRLAGEFIPNLITALDGVLTDVLDLFDKLPDAFLGALQKLPDMLMKLIDRLPDAIRRAIPAIIETSPKIAVAVVEMIIKDGPRIYWAIFQGLYYDFPKAIAQGIWDGVKGIFDIFKSFKIPKIEDVVDVQKLGDDLKKAIQKATGSNSKLFEVTDLLNPATAAKPKELIQKLQDAGNEAQSKGKDLWDWIKDLWDKLLDLLKKLWEWVEELWAKLLVDLKKVWDVVYKDIILPALNFTKETWEASVELFNASIDALKLVWEASIKIFRLSIDYMKLGFNETIQLLKIAWTAIMGLLNIVFKGIVDSLGAAWNTLKAVWGTLMDMFQGKISFMDGVRKLFGETFDSIKAQFDIVIAGFKAVFQEFAALWPGISKILGDLFNGIRDMFQGIVKAFGEVFNGLGDIFNNTIKPIFDGLKDAFDGIVNGMKNIFNKLIDIFNNLKIPQVDVSGRVLGQRFDFTLIPAMDLIPGDIPNFAQGGIVQGMAAMAGDSTMNDKVLAMLSPGEAIIPRSAMENPVVAKMIKDIIAGKSVLPKFATGGIVTDNGFDFNRRTYVAGAQGSNSSSSNNNVYNFNINMKIENKDSMDENFVRNRLMPAIKESLRRDSLDGKLVISGRGVF